MIKIFNRILENTQLYLIDITSKKKKNIIWYFLFFLSFLYKIILNIRFFLYKKNIFNREHSLGNLVISIGNITCGGTGKTPIALHLARTLSEKKRRVAILSRGYKSKSEHSKEPFVVSDGKNIVLDIEKSGDEPVMLAKNLPNVVIISNKNRVKSGKFAIKKFGIDTIILDDGFQYLALKSHINILLINTQDPFGNHYLLPSGLLREPIKNIRRADYIFFTKSKGSKSLRHLKNFVKKHSKKDKIIECTYEQKFLKEINSNMEENLNYLNGKRIATILGIAKPVEFQDSLNKYNCHIIFYENFMDHHAFDETEIIKFVKKCKKEDIDCVITTEKDYVRLIPFLHILSSIKVFFVKIEISILSGKKYYDECIKKICWNE